MSLFFRVHFIGYILEYLFFLNYVNGDLVPNSNHYGIRKIKGTKVYDYKTDSYIETALLN